MWLSPLSPREAIMVSMFLHGGLLVLLLLFPGVFSSPGPMSFEKLDTNGPIPLTFYTPPTTEPPPSFKFGDAGSERRSDPRPESTQKSTDAEPFALGNNPNRFVAPPIPAPAAPSPVSQDAAAGERTPGPPQASVLGGAGLAHASHDSVPLPSGLNGTPVPDSGGPPGVNGDTTRPEGKIRQLLSSLSVGNLGGGPMRFHHPTGGFAARQGSLSFDTPGFDWGPYARKLYWIIWTNWTQRWPPAAHAGVEGVVTVRFRIHGDGTISGIEILSTSGIPAFDICATMALEASSPLPPLPVDFPRESEGITARFLYNMWREDQRGQPTP